MDAQAFFWAFLGALLAALGVGYWLTRRKPAVTPSDPVLAATLQKLQQDVGGLLERMRQLPSAATVDALK